MKHHLNTLFVTTPRAYLRKQGEAVLVTGNKEMRLRTPLHVLGGIVTFGAVGASPGLLAACARAGIAVSFLTEYGGFLARVCGFTSGNVLLRREQYRRADSEAASLAIARWTVEAKIANSRVVLLRAGRDYPDSPRAADLERAAARLSYILEDVRQATSLDSLRGLEGDAARTYFSVFNAMITAQGEGFSMTGRSRRPPLDPVNALLSFLYSMLAHDARSACEAAGLDPAVGFLHRDRPGRPGLALDLIEELRAFLVDRLTLSLINRGQVRPEDFVRRDSGAYEMTESVRKAVLVAYQKRKQETITHPFLKETTTVGLLVHIQALLMGRYLRGELDAYPAFFAK